MKKLYPKHNTNDINLRELVITIWDEKIKIALIAFIISVIFFTQNHFKTKEPNVLKYTLEISMAKAEQFLSYVPIYTYLGTTISSQNILEEFVEEFLDYEELIIVLKDVEDIKKRLSPLSEREQQQMLYKYANLFNMKTALMYYGGKNTDATTKNKYVIDFTWGYDGEQSRSILDQALKLTLSNLEKSVFLKLNNSYKIKKDQIIKKDLERIAFLSEQSIIARSLNLEESKVDFYNLSDVQTSFTLSNGGSGPYYLRGFKAIDMEITVIKNRNYPRLIEIEQKIDLFKKNNLRWVNYNIFLLDVKSMNYNMTVSPAIVILLSLLFGSLYVLISNKLKSYIGPKKKTK